MIDPDDKEKLVCALARLEEITTNARRCLAAVDQMNAACEAVIASVRRERVREKWRNLAVSVACALAGCLVGALVFGR